MVDLVGRFYDGFIEDEIREMLVAAVVHVGGVSAVALRPRDLYVVWGRPCGVERVQWALVTLRRQNWVPI